MKNKEGEIIRKIFHMISSDDMSPSKEFNATVRELIKVAETNDLSDLLMDYCQEADDLMKIAYTLDVSSWLTSDNGGQMHQNVRSWLDGDDENRIWVALNLEVYPIMNPTYAAMKAKFEGLVSRHPRFKMRCNQWLELVRKEKGE